VLFPPPPAATHPSFTHGGHCTRSGPCVHTQQAGLLQRPVRWLPCQSADAVAVCSASCGSSCTWAAWPCSSLSSHAQLVTLAELSTASHIQAVLADLQVSARLGARVPFKTLCADCLRLGRSRLRSADENQLLVPRTQTVTLDPERSPHPDQMPVTLCRLSCVIRLCHWTVSNVH